MDKGEGLETKTYKTKRGSNLSYYEVGEGERIIVFIHGQQTSSESYLEVAKENNIVSMPFAEIEGNVVDSKALQKYIMEV